MASNSNSGQKFISRNRKPRVHITYEDPYDAEKLVELPFVMGVLADLSGNASQVAKPDMNDRKFLDIDMDNFDKRMARDRAGGVDEGRQQARRERGRRKAVGEPQVHQDGRFLARRRSPARFRRWPSCSQAREQLANLLNYMDGKAAAEDTLEEAAGRSGPDGGDEGQARAEAVGRQRFRTTRR